MDTAAAARRWIDGWSRGWPAGDVAAIEAIYTEDAVFRSHPFREPQAPGAYAAWAFADEDEQLVDLAFGEPVLGDGTATIEYWAVVRRREGGEATIAGISRIRFAEDGRACEQRDYWAMDEGRHPPNFAR